MSVRFQLSDTIARFAIRVVTHYLCQMNGNVGEATSRKEILLSLDHADCDAVECGSVGTIIDV